METNRFLLRPLKSSDLEAIYHNWTSDPKVTEYVTWNTHKSIGETKEILDIWLEEEKSGVTHRFAIVPKGEDKPIGMIDIAKYEDGIPEIGYTLSRKYWNQGIMTEVCKRYIDYLFSQGFKEIHIEAIKENIGSNRVIEKCGFNFIETVTKQLSKFKPIMVTINRYKIIKE